VTAFIFVLVAAVVSAAEFPKAPLARVVPMPFVPGGGPSVRVSPNSTIEIRWIADFIGDGRVDVFDNANGGTPVDTKTTPVKETDGRVHRAKNLGTEDVVVYNTFIVPQGRQTTVNIPGNAQQCGPPSDVNECKDDGWVKFTWPRSFIDQGDCVQYVRYRPR
jgi:hypothetical protein